MQPKFLNPSAGPSRTPIPASRPAPLLRFPTALPAGISGLPSRSTANSLAIQEAVEKLMGMSLDPVPEAEQAPSLIRGFKATVPSSEIPKQRRRMIRGGLVDADLGYEKIGLKKLGDRARGLLTEGDGEDQGGLNVNRKSRRKRRERSDARKREGKLHLEDLVKQADEIALDKDNLNVRAVSVSRHTHWAYAKL
jgi:division protein 1